MIQRVDAMSAFSTTYRNFIKSASQSDSYFGYDFQSLAKIEPVLNFLFSDWWKVNLTGLDRIPTHGPALIVGNNSGLIPWTALMLMYALMCSKKQARKLNIVADMGWVNDERLYSFLVQIGFVPYSADNLDHLFAKGELIILFPEINSGQDKTVSEQYRLREFDWTQFLPAMKVHAPIFPLATLGCDEAVSSLLNIKKASKLLALPAFPITPFFPWLPFPMNMASFPVHWKMNVMRPIEYERPSLEEVEGRHDTEEAAKNLARFAEGEIQAELNRMLRMRIRSV